MAVAYASQSNAGWTSGVSSQAVTKPSGLEVGDIMLAYCATNPPGSFSLPSGFTSLGSTTSGGNNYNSYLGWKVATSGDVAATDFTFSFGGNTTNFCAIVRVTGATWGATPLKSSGLSQANTSTPSLTGITPDARGNNLLFQFWHGSDAVGSTASYAIATSNPSWTEIIDISQSATAGVGVAWALRPEVTATGNFSCAAGNASTDWGGWLVSLAPYWETSHSDGVTLTESAKENINMAKSDSVTITENITNTKQRLWTPENKPSPSVWTPENK